MMPIASQMKRKLNRLKEPIAGGAEPSSSGRRG
jgi:hypothetical protein